MDEIKVEIRNFEIAEQFSNYKIQKSCVSIKIEENESIKIDEMVDKMSRIYKTMNPKT